MNTYSSFGRKLASLRTSLKISQEELAQNAGVSRSMLSKIERDEVNPTIIVAGKLARSLNTTISTLLGERPGSQPNMGNIHKFIESLNSSDEQLDKIIADRIALEPELLAIFQRTYIFDKDCRYLYASILAKHSFGVSPSEMVGKHLREVALFAVESVEEIESKIRSVFSNGDPLTAETACSHLDGLGYYEYRLKPLFNNSNTVGTVMMTVRTITSRKLAEIELKSQLIRLHQMIDVCPIGVISVDKYGTITVFNKAALILLSPYSSETWIGKSIKRFAEFVNIDMEKLRLNRALHGEEINEFVLALGQHWRITASPLRDATDTISGAISFFQKAIGKSES